MKVSLGALALGVCVTAQAAAPVITSFTDNGILVCTNLAPGSVATVEWAPAVTGPWTDNWAGLDTVAVDSNGMLRASVPMLYRVRGTTSVSPGVLLIAAGSFTMGNCMSPSEGNSSELPLHTVTVSAFCMDANLVTYSLWTNVYHWAISHGYSFDNTGSGKAANHPVQTVNWYDVVKWCNARSERESREPCYYADTNQTTVYRSGAIILATNCVNWAANGYRLPTEAEWEKAARGGAAGHRFPRWDADTINWNRANYYARPGFYAYDVNHTGGYDTNFTSGGHPFTSPVGSFAPNGYGLYDMAGNVCEWCWDYYSDTYYGSSPSTDPRGPAPASYTVLRGGSFEFDAGAARCAARNCAPASTGYNYIGFRCVRRF
jgi:formylglycine-generating enzyme